MERLTQIVPVEERFRTQQRNQTTLRQLVDSRRPEYPAVKREELEMHEGPVMQILNLLDQTVDLFSRDCRLVNGSRDRHL